MEAKFMKVYAGEYIEEIETGKKLRVEHDFEIEIDTPMSHAFDFLAKYSESGVVRGFLLSDEGDIWERV